tara:strand:- start:52 stop:240 length:189 start_codon:yes stop_codon:yes gene_type:complete
MKINLDYDDFMFIKDILLEQDEICRNQIVSGYTDNSTSLDRINVLEEKQKRISKIFESLKIS